MPQASKNSQLLRAGTNLLRTRACASNCCRSLRTTTFNKAALQAKDVDGTNQVKHSVCKHNCVCIKPDHIPLYLTRTSLFEQLRLSNRSHVKATMPPNRCEYAQARQKQSLLLLAILLLLRCDSVMHDVAILGICLPHNCLYAAAIITLPKHAYP